MQSSDRKLTQVESHSAQRTCYGRVININGEILADEIDWSLSRLDGTSNRKMSECGIGLTCGRVGKNEGYWVQNTAECNP